MQTQQPSPIRLSVVVLTYNQECYIRQALDSILMQDFEEPWEILIGDDASTDGTPQILKNYQTEHPEKIRLIRRTKNLGASRNLYELLKEAQGTYIALLEGDDYWLDSAKLRKQVTYLEQNPQFSGCTHDCLVTDAEGRQVKQQHPIWLCTKPIFTLQDCKGFYLSGQTATLAFRNIFKDNGWDDTILYRAHHLISDRTLQTILTANAPIYHMKETMSVYRCNISADGTNATAKLFVDHAESPLENLNLTFALEDYLKEKFGVTLPCRRVKHMFFATAVLKWMIHPSKQTKAVVIKMITHEKVHKVEYLLALPIEILRRLRYRLRRNQ